MKSSMIDRLLIRALEAVSESASDLQLFTWLGAGADEYGHIDREPESQSRIQNWFADHPERYKAVLDHCIRLAAQNHHYYQYERRLQYASPPSDLGLWHLQRAGHENEEVIAKIHLINAVQALVHQRGAQGLSLEALAEWGHAHPERAYWLEEQLVCPVENWRREAAARSKQGKMKRLADRSQRTRNIMPHLSAISAGTAPAKLLGQLAGVWLGHFSDIHGQTILSLSKVLSY